MPGSPKIFKAIMIAETSFHVIKRFYAIYKCPNSGYAPNYEKFIPYLNQQKERKS